MALFKLLFSILLFSFVYSAPVEVPAGTASEGRDPVPTISDIDEDVKPSTKSDVLISTQEASTLPPTEHSDVVVESNEDKSLKPSVFVPTGVVNEEETNSPSSEFPLVRDPDPTSDPKVASQAPVNVEDQHTQNENSNEQGSSSKADRPTIDVEQQDDIKPIPDDGDIREPIPLSVQQPGDPFVNDRMPISDPNPFGDGESDGPPQINDGDLPEIPNEDKPLDQTSEPFGKGANEGTHIYPEPPIEAETVNQEKVVYPPSEHPPEDDTAKQIAPESVQNEPQDTDGINIELPQEPIGSDLPQEPVRSDLPQEPVGSELPQDGEVAPIGILPPENVVSPVGSELPQEPVGSELPQDEVAPIGMLPPENVAPPFESYDDPTIENEDDTRMPTFDQSKIPDEEDNSPDPPFPAVMDGPEEMVGDPVEPPLREEEKPPAILVRGDLVPPVVSVIQIEQQPYLNRENVALSDDSFGGETPEEEVSNPDSAEQQISFDNRPEKSGPMNIL